MTRLSPCFAIATAVSFALGGCGASADVGNSVGPPTKTERSVGLIAVTTSYRLGRLGPVYREGVMVEVILRDAGGRKVDVQTQRPEVPLVFTDLEPGTYILEPGLRPCDGNCGYLDARVDTCTRRLDVDGPVKVKVDFIIGSECRVRTS
jgi:hypothetical protein